MISFDSTRCVKLLFMFDIKMRRKYYYMIPWVVAVCCEKHHINTLCENSLLDIFWLSGQTMLTWWIQKCSFVLLIVVNISCGHEEVTDFGDITSLGYPELYHEHQTCEWNITVNDTKVIKLLVLDLDMEDSLGCIYDYLLVST